MAWQSFDHTTANDESTHSKSNMIVCVLALVALPSPKRYSHMSHNHSHADIKANPTNEEVVELIRWFRAAFDRAMTAPTMEVLKARMLDTYLKLNEYESRFNPQSQEVCTPAQACEQNTGMAIKVGPLVIPRYEERAGQANDSAVMDRRRRIVGRSD